jgi:hypothetical protein
MGLLSSIFGSKPPFGTPPFAPPHPVTGGSELPTTPETMPAKHGLAGFIDRTLMPTNALGQFGQALVAAGGGPFGTAMAYMLQAGAKRHEKAKPHYAHIGDSFGVVDDNTGQFTPTKVYQDPTPKMNFIPDGMGGGQWVAVPGAAPGMPSLPSGGPVGKITPLDDPAPANAAPAGGVSKFKSAIVGQESGGRYGVPNSQGSGAMGIGQVMPQTAKVLAGRLGLPYRPELLGGTDPAAQDYQNRITDAAVMEAWNASGGDPAKAAMYYFGGSDHSKWGPKTHRYASDILSRMGG